MLTVVIRTIWLNILFQLRNERLETWKAKLLAFFGLGNYNSLSHEHLHTVNVLYILMESKWNLTTQILWSSYDIERWVNNLWLILSLASAFCGTRVAVLGFAYTSCSCSRLKTSSRERSSKIFEMCICVSVPLRIIPKIIPQMIPRIILGKS